MNIQSKETNRRVDLAKGRTTEVRFPVQKDFIRAATSRHVFGPRFEVCIFQIQSTGVSN